MSEGHEFLESALATLNDICKEYQAWSTDRLAARLGRLVTWVFKATIQGQDPPSGMVAEAIVIILILVGRSDL